MDFSIVNAFSMLQPYRYYFCLRFSCGAFVSGVKYHSGKNSCSKCTIVGFTALKPSELRRQVRPKGRVVFSCLAAPRRDKRQRDDPEHHNNYSIIEELELADIVNDFPVDPMHYR
jgi:hypothetical protein